MFSQGFYYSQLCNLGGDLFLSTLPFQSIIVTCNILYSLYSVWGNGSSKTMEIYTYCLITNVKRGRESDLIHGSVQFSRSVMSDSLRPHES